MLIVRIDIGSSQERAVLCIAGRSFRQPAHHPWPKSQQSGALYKTGVHYNVVSIIMTLASSGSICMHAYME